MLPATAAAANSRPESQNTSPVLAAAAGWSAGGCLAPFVRPMARLAPGGCFTRACAVLAGQGRAACPEAPADGACRAHGRRAWIWRASASSSGSLPAVELSCTASGVPVG